MEQTAIKSRFLSERISFLIELSRTSIIMPESGSFRTWRSSENGELSSLERTRKQNLSEPEVSPASDFVQRTAR